MEVPNHVHEWLVSSNLIPKGKPASEGNFLIDQATTKDFENGVRFGPVIKLLYEAVHATPKGNLDSLKKVTGVAAKAYNWKVISEELEHLGVSLPQEAKAAAMSGNANILRDLLTAIYEVHNDAMQSRFGNTKDRLSTIPEEEKDLRQVETCQEFFLVSLCQSFSLKPNQVYGLLADNRKFLGRIVAKGLKGDLDPVVAWVQQIYTNIDTLTSLMSTETEGINLTFKVLELGLSSRSTEVVQWCCRILSRLGIECVYSGLSANAWEWFTTPQGGFDLTMMAIQRDSAEIFPYAIELLLNFSQNNLVELFTLHLRNFLQDTKDYLSFISEMLPFLKEMQSNTEEIFLAGVVGYWAEIAMREAELDSRRGSSGKMLALALIVELWKEFYCGKDGDILINPVLNLLSRAAREEQMCVKSCAMALMFDCLEFLAKSRNAHSASFYKALTFVLVGNYSVRPLREMAYANLKTLLVRFPAMPTFILVEPLVKQLHIDGAFSVADFDFLSVLADHPSLTSDQAVMLADALAKVLMSDIVHSKPAKDILQKLTERFLPELPVTQFLDKLLTFSLKSICTEEIFRTKKLHRISLGDLNEMNVQQGKIQTKHLICDFVLWLLNFRIADLNQRIKATLIECYTEYKQQTGREFKAYKVVLDWFGDWRQTENQGAIVIYEEQQESPGNSLVPYSQAMTNYRSTLREDRLQDDIRFRQTRSDFPWERAFNDLQKAKQKHLDAVKKRTDEEERMKQRLDFKKKKVKRQLELRKLEQGVSRTNIGTIVGFNEAQVIAAKEEVELREFSKEEADEDEQVKMVLNKYSRVFRALFQMYSGTGFVRRTEVISEFDWLAERKTKISESEYLKLLKDHGVVPEYLNKEQLGDIIEAWARKQKQAEVNQLDFEGFRAVFCQMAYYIFSREPRDYSHMPPAVSVRMLIDAMRSHLRLNKKSTELYDEPDPGSGDKEVIKQLNMRIAVNPEMELPEGYIRVTERDFEIYYGVPRQLPCPENKVICFELLDEIMYDALSIHVLEPLVRFVSYERCKGLKPKKPKIELPPIHERSADHFKKKIKEFASTNTSTPSMKVGRTVKLGPVLKYEIAKLKPEEKPPATEVAELLEDMLHSLGLGAKAVVGRWSRNIENPVVRQREEEFKKEQENQEKEKKRQLERAKALREAVQKMKQAREIQKKAEEAMTEPQRADLEAKRKARRELLAKKQAERKTQMAEVRRKREEERQQKIEAQTARKPSVTAEVKKKHAVQLKAKLKTLKERFQKQQEQQVKPIVKDKELFETTRKLRPRIMKMQREHREDDEKRRAEINAFIENPQVKGLLTQYAESIETIFKFYCRNTSSKIEYGTEVAFNYMHAPEFYKFATQFNVVPTLVSVDYANRLFKVLTRGKVVKPGLPAMLSHDDFKVGIVKFAVDSRKNLRKYTEQGGDEGNQSDEINVELFEQFCLWLGLDQPLKPLQARLKELKETRGTSKDKRLWFQKSSSTPSLGLRAVKQSTSELPSPKLSSAHMEEEQGEDEDVEAIFNIP
mmetsp:Transcript_13488/g.25380  ORF Transcript_13488/g.25380 Transcript_13488/m.25380 type:complete len:1523 (+) Transcript_13488:11-4579(+)